MNAQEARQLSQDWKIHLDSVLNQVRATAMAGQLTLKVHVPLLHRDRIMAELIRLDYQIEAIRIRGREDVRFASETGITVGWS